MLHLATEIVRRTAAGETLALCLIVRTRGSCPQGVGAAMLVTQAGQTLGTLGGGCVEAEARVRALSVLGGNAQRLLTFRLDQDYGWDDGLVCGGVMDIAVCPLTSADTSQWRGVVTDLSSHRPATLRLMPVDETNAVRVFSHTFAPRWELIIAGAGHVGQALASIAGGLEFDVTVVDDRADLLTAERFPGATLVGGEIELALRRLRLDDRSCVVIVTRGHRHDASALDAVVRTEALYVGLIGSRTKTRAIFRALHAGGVPTELLEKVRAPIGLDIGAVTPAEIAVSIAAELIAVCRSPVRAVTPMKTSPEQLARWLAAPSMSGVEGGV